MVKKEKIDNPRINCITMKQNTPFTQRRHAHILNLILNRSLSLVLSLALSLSACHPDSLDDLDGDNDSGIALTHFQAEILTPTDGIKIGRAHV